MGCGVGRRHGSDLTLLWLWCRPAAAAPIQPLAQEHPYATVGPKKKKKVFVPCLVRIVCSSYTVLYEGIYYKVKILEVPLWYSGLTIRRCRELWCRLQTRLGSHVAAALA